MLDFACFVKRYGGNQKMKTKGVMCLQCKLLKLLVSYDGVYVYIQQAFCVFILIQSLLLPQTKLNDSEQQLWNLLTACSEMLMGLQMSSLLKSKFAFERIVQPVNK